MHPNHIRELKRLGKPYVFDGWTMLEFLTQEWTRFVADPLGRMPGYVTLLAWFGFAALKPFLNISGTFTGPAKLIQFMAFATIIAVIAAFLQNDMMTAIGFYVAGAAVVLKLNQDNFFQDDDWQLSCFATAVTFHFSFFAIALRGGELTEIGGDLVLFFATALAAGLQSIWYAASKDGFDLRLKTKTSPPETETIVTQSGAKITRRVVKTDPSKPNG